jgi:hypothetical protein
MVLEPTPGARWFDDHYITEQPAFWTEELLYSLHDFGTMCQRLERRISFCQLVELHHANSLASRVLPLHRLTQLTVGTVEDLPRTLR